jgi:hypothetical protein
MEAGIGMGVVGFKLAMWVGAAEEALNRRAARRASPAVML